MRLVAMASLIDMVGVVGSSPIAPTNFYNKISGFGRFFCFIKKPFQKLFRYFSETIAILLIAGCSSMSPAEQTWQAMNIIDVAQTMQIARHRECLEESDPITKKIIGRNPSESDVLLWGALNAIAYHYTSKHIENDYIRIGFFSVTIGSKSLAVAENNRNGITFSGVECH